MKRDYVKEFWRLKYNTSRRAIEQLERSNHE